MRKHARRPAGDRFPYPKILCPDSLDSPVPPHVTVLRKAVGMGPDPSYPSRIPTVFAESRVSSRFLLCRAIRNGRRTPAPLQLDAPAAPRRQSTPLRCVRCEAVKIVFGRLGVGSMTVM